MDSHRQLEEVVRELVVLFEITAPPIPIEGMLQNPRADMWTEIDMAELSGSFLSAIKGPYDLRMSLARFLARNIVRSPWGKQRQLDEVITSDAALGCFARMIVMPVDFINQLALESRQPAIMSLHFEVPENDARQRLDDLAAYS